MAQRKEVPEHVAIIMDGNGRWAKQRGQLRASGHRAGLKTVREIVRHAFIKGVKVLTLYAFSSENWNRPEKEVSALISLFIYALNNEIKSLHKNNIQLRVIGDITRFSEQLQKMICQAEQLTRQNDGLILNIAANYGGKWDIMQALQKIALQIQTQQLAASDINENVIAHHICLHDLPDVDLVIRTGGECRISNFLLWQIAYAELYFTEVLWPDFTPACFDLAIHEYVERERRFGCINMESQAEEELC